MCLYTHQKKTTDNSNRHTQCFHFLVILSKLVHKTIHSKKGIMPEVRHLGTIHRFLVSFSIITKKYILSLFQIKSTLHPKFYHQRASSECLKNFAISHTELSSYILHLDYQYSKQMNPTKIRPFPCDAKTSFVDEKQE